MSLDKVKEIVGRAAVYVPFNCEGIRIDYWDTDQDLLDLGEDLSTGRFYGTGEESGEEYAIDFVSVDLAQDMFYELKLIEVD